MDHEPWLEEISAALDDALTPEEQAALEARRHYAWYLRGVPYASYWKEQICQVNTMEDILRVTEGIKRELR